MATTFIVRTDKSKGLVPLHVRVQYSTPKLNLRLKTAHLQSSVSHYPKILHNLNMKNGRSDTPLS